MELLLSLLFLAPGLVVFGLSFAIVGSNNRGAWILPTIIISAAFITTLTILERNTPSVTEALSMGLFVQAVLGMTYPVVMAVGAWWFRRYRARTR